MWAHKYGRQCIYCEINTLRTFEVNGIYSIWNALNNQFYIHSFYSWWKWVTILMHQRMQYFDSSLYWEPNIFCLWRKNQANWLRSTLTIVNLFRLQYKTLCVESEFQLKYLQYLWYDDTDIFFFINHSVCYFTNKCLKDALCFSIASAI